MTRGTIDVVVGGQFGSECKGHVAAQLAARARNGGLAVRVYGPNAGHVVVGDDGAVWKLRQLPTAAVSSPRHRLAIAAGSEIDPDVLLDEVDQLDKAGYRVSERLVIDPQATWIEAHHYAIEADVGLRARIGSTGKGIGAARADRIMRTAKLIGDCDQIAHLRRESVAPLIRQYLATARGRGLDGGSLRVLIEGAQGHGLGLHSDNYPFTTSADCRASDFLAAAGAPPTARPVVWLVLRTRPIRVAGPSGPLFGETTFDDLGWETERTTVTNLVRRVGAWDSALAADAVANNGGSACRVALMQWDKEYPEAAGSTGLEQLSDSARESLNDWCLRIYAETGARVWMVGTGPSTIIDFTTAGGRVEVPTGAQERQRASGAAAQKRIRRSLRDEALTRYGGKCACCGETEREFLHLDHINEDGHDFRKETGIAGGAEHVRWLYRNGWPQGDIQVLCANCNMAKARGTCPHQRLTDD